MKANVPTLFAGSDKKKPAKKKKTKKKSKKSK